MKVGLRHRCVMSPWLFNIFMDGVVRAVRARVKEQAARMIFEGQRKWEVTSQCLPMIQFLFHVVERSCKV